MEKSTRPDISFAAHQVAWFPADPKQPHADAVKWLGCYLKATCDKGLVLQPTSKSFDVYVDADFAGNWNKDEAAEHSYTACSRHGYIIMYASCPVHWISQLQTEIALSTTESKFIGVSMALQATIPLMEMAKELNKLSFKLGSTKPRVHCCVFEDNCSALEIAIIPKIHPYTKHINVKYHYFRDYVDQGKITVHAINFKDQPADMLTKPSSEPKLIKHCYKVMGWGGESDIGRDCKETRVLGGKSGANALMNPPRTGQPKLSRSGQPNQ